VERDVKERNIYNRGRESSDVKRWVGYLIGWVMVIHGWLRPICYVCMCVMMMSHEWMVLIGVMRYNSKRLNFKLPSTNTFKIKCIAVLDMCRCSIYL
jgi:hypothetical protein